MIFSDVALQNKKILVTGASSGIGRQIAICLSKTGAKLVLTGRNRTELKKTQFQLITCSSTIISADLTNEEQLQKVFTFATEDGIKLDGMVYSSGVIPTIPLRNTSKEKLFSVFDINIISFIIACKYFCKNSVKESGSIVGISSIASVRPEKCQSLYAATKGAMNSAVQALAIELADKNITINTVLPGVTALKNHDSEEVDRLSEKQLFGAVDADDVASMCAFLLSDCAKHITGRQFYCDNGRFL